MELLELWAAAQDLSNETTRLLRAADEILADTARDLAAFDAIAQGHTISDEPSPPAWEWQHRPGIAGFWGVGLWLPDQGERPLPAVFVDSDLTPYDGVSFSSNTPAREEIERRMRVIGFPEEFFSLDLWLVGRSRPTPQHCGPREVVRVPGETSTLGCRVTLANKRPGITTAGHGAPTRGVVARVWGSRIGRVAETAQPQTQPAGTAEADIALIELDSNHIDVTGPTYTGYASITGGEDMTVNTNSASAQVWARATIPTLWLDRTHGAWGTVIETNKPVTVKGDSGSPVQVANRPGCLAGHVVAGDAARTIVQDLDYQLRRFNAQLRP
jgi:hypothetical protein